MQSADSGGGGELTQFFSSGGGGSQGKREPERGENTGRSMRHIKVRKTTRPSINAIVGVCSAIILRNRNMRMNLLHHKQVGI